VRFFGSQACAALGTGREGEPLEGTTLLRVLIVDDCKDGADTLATLLRMWGHEVQVAYDGPSALRLAGAFRPGVFLLDIGLPGMDGCRLARRLREQADFRGALVIAVSGYVAPSHRSSGEDAGFDDYLVKPIAPAALQELLARRAGREHPAEELSG
jgi:CheY-like chemotaxis protein